MQGVQYIQIQASLHYDDGIVVTLSSPLWKRDIRNGEFFPDAQICEIIREAGEDMSSIVEEKTAMKIHGEVKAKMSLDELFNYYWKKPPSEPFSLN